METFADRECPKILGVVNERLKDDASCQFRTPSTHANYSILCSKSQMLHYNASEFLTY